MQNLKMNPFCISSFKSYIKDKDTCHWVEHSKTKPTEFDKLLERKDLGDKIGSNLKVNKPTEEPVDTEKITE